MPSRIVLTSGTEIEVLQNVGEIEGEISTRNSRIFKCTRTVGSAKVLVMTGQVAAVIEV